MDAAHRLDALRTEGEAAVRSADDRFDAPVPHLDWTVGEVLGHLGGVHERVTAVLSGDVDEWPGRDSVDVPTRGLADWARGRLAGLVAALGAADLDDEVTTWAGPRDGGWLLRRVTNETAVHRWDIEAASGPPAEIPSELAVEIVDEFLTVIVPDRGLSGVDDIAAHDGATLHLHATDTGADSGEWFLTVTGDDLDVASRHDKGDVALRGPAGDLALWINGRIPPGRLDAFGDAEAVDWWSRAFRFD